MSKWEDNLIQFPRLLAELQAIGGFTEEQMTELCEQMDLPPHRIDELLGRAQDEWDMIKGDMMKGNPNNNRIALARVVLDFVGDANGDNGNDQDNVVDLLTNLMHYAKAKKLDFAAMCATAKMHFEAES